MSWFNSYIKSSVGAKHVMAITGLGLALFVLVHMLGNLSIYLGRDALNTYAEGLQSMPAVVWAARAGLLVLVLVHLSAAMRLTALNRAARPVKYQVFKPSATPFYARAMASTGIILVAFIIYHLLHFTVGSVMADAYQTYEKIEGYERHDVYSMVVLGFQNVAVAMSYVLAMVLLCMHLAHGVSSFFQSLGLSHPKYRGFIRKVGPVYALIILIGNCSIPLSVLAGIIK